jgi:hypothetical protein
MFLLISYIELYWREGFLTWRIFCIWMIFAFEILVLAKAFVERSHVVLLEVPGFLGRFLLWTRTIFPWCFHSSCVLRYYRSEEFDVGERSFTTYSSWWSRSSCYLVRLAKLFWKKPQVFRGSYRFTPSRGPSATNKPECYVVGWHNHILLFVPW